MSPLRLRISSSFPLSKVMAEEIGSSSSPAAAAAATQTPSPTTSSWAKTRSLWPSVLRWIPTSTDHIIAAEKRLLSVVKTPYVQERVNIGSGPPGSKHPEHVQHLVLVGSAGFSSEADAKSEWLTRFRATWKGALMNHLWESNFTPQKMVRGLGPWGPNIVQRYTSARFGAYASGEMLTETESKLLTAKASGELCLKYIFSFGAFARKPLLQRFDDPHFSFARLVNW
ncbi:1-acylglycerol-3-phosphate O-acyltransferase [Linum perenne]